MALTEDDLFYLRSKIGTAEPPTDADLDENYDRLGTLDAVAAEILATRLADLANQPDSFTVVGEYSQSTSKQMEAIAALLDTVISEEDELGELGTMTIVERDAPPVR